MGMRRCLFRPRLFSNSSWRIKEDEDAEPHFSKRDGVFLFQNQEQGRESEEDDSGGNQDASGKVAMSVGGSRDVPYNPSVNELLHFLQQLPRRKNVLSRIIQDRFHALRFKELNWSSTCAINAQVATDG